MNPKNKPNGHAALLAKSSGANGGTISLSEMGRAASVDASELSVATGAASSAATRADREACAEVAQVQGKGKQSPAAGTVSRPHRKKRGKKKGKKAGQKASKKASLANAAREIVPGLEPLPIDGEAFVDAVHSRVDLIRLEVKLLRSRDPKIVQRELAYLRELRYGKRAAPPDDEVPQIIVDMQRPERDIP